MTTTSLTCPQCGMAISAAETTIPDTCAHCGAAVNPAPPPTPYIHSIPPPPITLTPAQLQAAVAVNTLPYGELQHAATYLAMVRVLRGIGIGCIIYGCFQVLVGILMVVISAQDNGVIDAILGMIIFVVGGIIGIGFIAEGIWLLVAPSATGLLAAGITMFVTAALLVLGMNILSILLTLTLVFYGISLIKRYSKYGPLMAQRPAPDMLNEAKRLLDTLLKAKRKQSAELIEFSSSDALSRRYWRGLLQDNMLVLVALEARLFGKTISEIYFLHPSSVRIEVTRREVVGFWLKGVLWIEAQKWNGTIPRECHERYQEWQTRHTMPIPPVA